MGERRLSEQNSNVDNDEDDISLASDMDLSASFPDMENTARNISYLKISGEITDEPESYDTSFSDRLSVTTAEDTSGRTSSCSMNQNNYVSDGPLSESETSVLNDSFYSCGSKFDESNSDEKLDILLTEAKASSRKDKLEDTAELPRTTSFFNKMVDEKGNLKPINKPKSRHTR